MIIGYRVICMGLCLGTNPRPYLKLMLNLSAKIYEER